MTKADEMKFQVELAEIQLIGSVVYGLAIASGIAGAVILSGVSGAAPADLMPILQNAAYFVVGCYIILFFLGRYINRRLKEMRKRAEEWKE